MEMHVWLVRLGSGGELQSFQMLHKYFQFPNADKNNILIHSQDNIAFFSTKIFS